ncbi:MAG TPA: GIY-YIG nuclease family protein [Rhizomicrobium sp.]
MAAFVYVLLSKNKPKRTYVGWTLDLELRVARHNTGKGAKFTRGGKWTLIYAERHRTRNGAMRREVFLKRDRAFRTMLRER